MSDTSHKLSEFKKIHNMTKDELKQLDIDTLIDYIINLKNSSTLMTTCVCGQNYIKSFTFKCSGCLEAICMICKKQNVCFECCEKYCSDCSQECKFCTAYSCVQNKVCKLCITRKYPDWEITGCAKKCTETDIKLGNYVVVIKRHCIYPVSSDNVLCCGKSAYFSNICPRHFDLTDQYITDALSFSDPSYQSLRLPYLPRVVINICIDYFYAKISPSNLSDAVIKKICEKELLIHDGPPVVDEVTLVDWWVADIVVDEITLNDDAIDYYDDIIDYSYINLCASSISSDY